MWLFRKILSMLTLKRLKSYPKRGEIYIGDLNPAFGREIHKKRPVLIISNNTFNQVFPTVVILPFSSIVPQVIRADMVKVNKIRGLDQDSAILITQVRAIDKIRLFKRIGILSKDKLLEVEAALKLVLGMTEI